MRYLLDTHTLIWLMTDNSRLPGHVKESVLYCQDDYSISSVSLIELLQLQQGGRIAFRDRPSTVSRLLGEMNICVEPLAVDILDHLYDIDIPRTPFGSHSDPFDRIIIATAIRRGMTLVSADTKFPWYRDNCGLHLLEI